MKNLFLVIMAVVSMFVVTNLYGQEKYIPPTKNEFVKILKLLNEYETIQKATPIVVKRKKNGDRTHFVVQISKYMSISFYTMINDEKLQDFKKRLSFILKSDPQITQTRKDEKTWIFHIKKGEVKFDFEITNEAMKSSTKFWVGFSWGNFTGVLLTSGLFLLIIL